MKELSKSILKSKIVLGLSGVVEFLLLIPLSKHIISGSYSSAIGVALFMFIVSFPLRRALRNISEKSKTLNIVKDANTKK